MGQATFQARDLKKEIYNNCYEIEECHAHAKSFNTDVDENSITIFYMNAMK